MRIGRLEIRWTGHRPLVTGHSAIGEADLHHALAVPDTSPIWKAVHQIIDLAEAESLNDARRVVANDRLMLNSLGAADGAALVRSKLNTAREQGLRSREVNSETRKP